MTKIVNTSITTISDGSGAAGGAGAGSTEELFSALFSLIKPDGPDEGLAAALNGDAVAAALPGMVAETGAGDGEGAGDETLDPALELAAADLTGSDQDADGGDAMLSDALAALLVAAPAIAEAETDDNAPAEQSPEARVPETAVPAALPQLTRLLTTMARTASDTGAETGTDTGAGTGAGTGTGRFSRSAAPRSLQAQSEAHSKLVKLMALVNELPKSVTDQAAKLQSGAAADPDPLPLAGGANPNNQLAGQTVRPDAAKPAGLVTPDALGTMDGLDDDSALLRSGKSDQPASQSLDKQFQSGDAPQRDLDKAMQKMMQKTAEQKNAITRMVEQSMEDGVEIKAAKSAISQSAAGQSITGQSSGNQFTGNQSANTQSANSQSANTQSAAGLAGNSNGSSGNGSAGQQQSGTSGQFDQSASKTDLIQHRRLNMLGRDWQGNLMRVVEQAVADGQQRITVQLNPERLGKLQIQLNVSGDATSIQIRSDNPAAASMLGESEARLSQMMAENGMRLSNLDVQGGQRHGADGQAGQQARQDQGGDNGSSQSGNNRSDREKTDDSTNIKNNESEVPNSEQSVNILA